jgi:membrane protein YdbS with pleckstrin-like domain
LFKDRLVTKKGVFTNQFSFLELYRVKDYEVYQSFFMRLFNIMNLQLITSDKTDPILNLKGIPKSDVFQLIRENVEEQRRIKGVREFD